jgi:hypothetical protein
VKHVESREIEAICFSETSVEFQRTIRRCIPEGITVYTHIKLSVDGLMAVPLHELSTKLPCGKASTHMNVSAMLA